MGSTTGKGYPYPVGTDLARDGDNAIRALAEAVDTNLGAAATGVPAIPAGNSPVSTAVTFPAGRFTVAPVVTVSTSASVLYGFVTSATTATGCTIGAASVAGAGASIGAGQSFRWIAIQV